jgi:lincosamide nucleotidyltransferase A/C/D/E
MTLSEVLRVLDRLDAVGVPHWLEGGWGVDALIGRQTRSHRDLDLDIDATQEALAIEVLNELNYQIETDWRPNRVELVARGHGWVDVHPLTFDRQGNAVQAALDGSSYTFPRSYFRRGHLGSRQVGCFSVDAQRLFHTGYEHRSVDTHDLALLDSLAEPR